MKCKVCGFVMIYDYHIADKMWKRAWEKVGKPKTMKEDGVLCANCCLQTLGLDVWEIRKLGPIHQTKSEKSL